MGKKRRDYRNFKNSEYTIESTRGEVFVGTPVEIGKATGMNSMCIRRIIDRRITDFPRVFKLTKVVEK